MSGDASLPRLMLVSDRHRTRGRELFPLIRSAVRGGVGLVQIREPDLKSVELRGLCAELRDALPPDVRIVVNRDRQVARTLHLGLHLPAREPSGDVLEEGGRRRYGLVGRSAHDLDEAQRAVEDGASYVVVGTIYATVSKPGRAPAGPELIRTVKRHVGAMPVFAIGGVEVSRIPELIHAGAHGVAVCGALLGANDPQRVAQAMCLALSVAVTADHDPRH